MRIAVGILLAACSSAAEPALEPTFAPTDPPRSYDAMVEQYGLRGAPPARWREALTPLAGQPIEWSMRSWGGEVTSATFSSPDDRHGAVRARVRLVTPSVRGDLGAVDDAGIGVVACAGEESEGPMMLLRQDGPPAPAAGGEDVVLRGRVWGATDESGSPTVWILDCEILAR
jgi:hypothetical protein